VLLPPVHMHNIVHSIEPDIAMVSKIFSISYYVLANYLLMNSFRGDRLLVQVNQPRDSRSGARGIYIAGLAQDEVARGLQVRWYQTPIASCSTFSLRAVLQRFSAANLCRSKS